MRTIDKYFSGYAPKTSRKRTSKIDDYYEIILLLLSKESKQVFYYKRVLWQYLKDNHGLNCSQLTFRAYKSKKLEFQSYFDSGKANNFILNLQYILLTLQNCLKKKEFYKKTLLKYISPLGWRERINFLREYTFGMEKVTSIDSLLSLIQLNKADHP